MASMNLSTNCSYSFRLGSPSRLDSPPGKDKVEDKVTQAALKRKREEDNGTDNSYNSVPLRAHFNVEKRVEPLFFLSSDRELLNSWSNSEDLEQKISELSQAALKNEVFIKEMLKKFPTQTALIVRSVGKLLEEHLESFDQPELDKNFFSHEFITQIFDQLPANKLHNIVYLLHWTSLHHDEDFMKKMLDKLPENGVSVIFCGLGDDLKNDPSFMEKVLDKLPANNVFRILDVLSDDLKNDPSFMEKVLDKLPANNVLNIVYLLEDGLSDNQSFMEKVLDKLPENDVVEILIGLGHESVLKNDPSFMGKVLDKLSENDVDRILEVLSDGLSDNQSFMEKVLDKLPENYVVNILDVLSDGLTNNQSFMEKVLDKLPENDVDRILYVLSGDLLDKPSFMEKVLEKFPEEKVETFCFDLDMLINYSEQEQIIAAIADVLEINEEDLWKRIGEKNPGNIDWRCFFRAYRIEEFNPNISDVQIGMILKEELVKVLKEIKAQLSH